MNRSDKHKFSEIESFDDFRAEKEELILRSELVKMKLSYSLLSIGNMLSVTNLFYTVGREFIMPKISDFFNNLFKKDNQTSVT